MLFLNIAYISICLQLFRVKLEKFQKKRIKQKYKIKARKTNKLRMKNEFRYLIEESEVYNKN